MPRSSGGGAWPLALIREHVALGALRLQGMHYGGKGMSLSMIGLPSDWRGFQARERETPISVSKWRIVERSIAGLLGLWMVKKGERVFTNLAEGDMPPDEERLLGLMGALGASKRKQISPFFPVRYDGYSGTTGVHSSVDFVAI